MNSFPTPESSPVIQSGVNGKSKDAGNEEKKSSSKNKKKLSKSLSPNTSVNGKRKSLFPKVVLPLFPKIANKKTASVEKNAPVRRKSISKKVEDPDFVPDSSPNTSDDEISLVDFPLRKSSEFGKKLDLNSSKSKSPKRPKTPKLPKRPKTPKTPKTPKKAKSPKSVETQKSPKKNKESSTTAEIIVIEINDDDDDKNVVPAKKMKVNEEPSVDEKKEEILVTQSEIDWKFGVKWVPGKLAWARFAHYPYWPCVVTLDPESMTFHRAMASAKRLLRNLVHVQYFGDNERHSWVAESNMLPFTGADDFDKFLENLSLAKKKNREQRLAFTVGPTWKPKWEVAICEATEILSISDEARACIFAPAPPPVVKAPSSLAAKKKRKFSTNESPAVVPAKKSKPVFQPRVTRSQTPKIPSKVSSRRRSEMPSKTNLDPSKKNSKLNKSTGDLSKIFAPIPVMGTAKLNGAHSKSVGNLAKLFETLTPKPNGKYPRNGEKPVKMNGRYHRNLKSSQGDILENLSPPTPPSSVLNSSWDEDKKNIDVIDYDSKLLALCDAELEDEIKSERWSDEMRHEEEFRNRSIPSDADIDSDLEAVNKSTKKRKSRSKRDSGRASDSGKSDNKEQMKNREKAKLKESKEKTKDKEPKEKNKEKEKIKDKEKEKIKDKEKEKIKDREKEKIKDREKEKIKDKEKEKIKDKESKEKTKENGNKEKETKEKEGKDSSDGNEFEKDLPKLTKPINLFKGIRTERVCQICEQTGKLVRCKGPCYSYYHLKCVKPGDSSPEQSEHEDNNFEDEVFQDWKEIKKKIAESESFTEQLEVKAEESPPPPPPLSEEDTFKCIDCLSSVAPACFICNDREIDRVRCSANTCGKYYHSACLKTWPQSQWQGVRLVCPYHMCHTCNSDNPQNGHMLSKPNEKLARCVRCPSAYHTSSSCLPAGSEILTGNQIICPKHYKCRQAPLNATWCFLCTKGGSLICCESCPTSFHPECLGIKAPDGAFICEDCETGRLPLYGEIVWVKLGSYRWWPSKICFPDEVPVNVENLNHEIGEFCVMFFGTRNYYWVHKGRAFLYQEGDAVAKTTGKKSFMDGAFRRAIQEAHDYHQILKKQKALCSSFRELDRGQLKPPYYVKLKTNKPVGNVKAAEVDSIVACACSPTSDNACAQDSDCLNRMLLFECSPEICPAGAKCQNQCFAQRLYPALEPFHTDGRGWGLRALEAIKPNQFVIEYVGEVIDEAEYKRRLQRKKELKNENFYFLTIDTNRMIDAEPKGNLSRFMNHSCQPNCETQKWTVNGDTRIGLFAVRDIEPGEELTFNYNLACDGEEKKPCLCGASNCSGFIGLKVKKRNSAIQEKKVEKMEKPKIPRKYGPKKVICSNCQKEIASSELIKCKQKGCSKKYHKSCVGQTNCETKFICPSHLCFKCGTITTNYCSVCKIAFCQVHQSENMVESKGSFVCKNHKNGLSLVSASVEDRKVKSDNLELDKSSFTPPNSSSPIVTSKTQSKIQNQIQEQAARVSIEEVHLSCEEYEETLTEDTDDTEEPDNNHDKSNSTRRRSRRISQKLDALKSLNSEQLLAIIGGGV